MNEKFRTIGLDTEDKITEFIDYIDDLEDTEEIKSDVYGFFEEESSYNENHIPAYVVMTKYKGKYIVWVEDQCCDFAISYPPYNLCDIFSTYDEANEYYKSLAHSGIKPLSEQVEECKSQLIDEVDLRVSTMVQQDNFLTYIKNSKYAYYYPLFVFILETALRVGDDDDKIRLNQRKPSKYKGLRRFGPEKNLQRINKFMKERPIFYKNLIQMKENIRFYLRCFYCITKVMILQFNSENRTELARNG